MSERKTRPWTEAHQREALRRTYELAAELVHVSRYEEARLLVADAGHFVNTEESWRDNLRFDNIFDPARVDREVARVRALAEGRLVRETVWRVQFPSGHMTCPSLKLARLHAKPNKWRRRCPVVRVTRLLRRPR